MTVPAFDEYEPAADCPCAGCVRERRARARPYARQLRAGAHPAAHCARRALVVATAAGVVLSGGGAGAGAAAATLGHVPGGAPVPVRVQDPVPVAPPVPGDASVPVGAPDPQAPARPVQGEAPAPVGAQDPQPVVRPLPGGVAPDPDPVPVPVPGIVPDPDPEPETPQGGQAPLHGGPAPGPAGAPGPALRRTTRADIINRAKLWVNAKVPYSMSKYWSDGYRQDCSGFVSMAWNLPGNEWTGSLAKFGIVKARKDLQPGDILLFHNTANPTRGSHVTIFGGWTDYTHTHYIAYEQAKPHARMQATPMAYWSNSSSYVAYRYKGIIGATATAGPGEAASAYPGPEHFGPGATSQYITQLGRLLMEWGAKGYGGRTPGPRWTEADRRATQAFQRAQGWTGKEADGLPGPLTWRRLVSGTGKAVPGVAQVSVPGYPGRGNFRPGRSNAHVEKLGRQLVKRGFGKHYTSDPGPQWTEADRRNVEAFQRAQGWRGGAADGYPGPETWRRLFS
ncbi:peptidoglycan-binding protein [Streptomyces sp. NPDC057445]|uniref:peptidoglycan-binding protein n=1 Tax=Streptomyces sp. NPDC057445 TaxID=3346136 RepID=UPI0036C0DE18